MSGYTKLFSTILASTIWREPADVRVVWITMLAMADAQGRVDGSVPGLADLARVTIEQCQAALKCLSEPDFFSRTKELEGRRIKEIDGGWLILNYLKYRESDSADLRREQNREAQKRWRHKHKLTVSKGNGSKPSSAQAEAEASAEANATIQAERRAPSKEEWLKECSDKHPEWPSADASRAWDHYESQGWKRGKSLIVKWRSCVSTCHQNWKDRDGPGSLGKPRLTQADIDAEQLRLSKMFEKPAVT
jgi:hypothetical protein